MAFEKYLQMVLECHLGCLVGIAASTLIDSASNEWINLT